MLKPFYDFIMMNQMIETETSVYFDILIEEKEVRLHGCN